MTWRFLFSWRIAPNSKTLVSRRTTRAAPPNFSVLLQQVRAIPPRLLQRLFAPPAAYLVMVAADQNVRHFHPAKFRGTRVVRIVEQSPGGACGVRRLPARLDG